MADPARAAAGCRVAPGPDGAVVEGGTPRGVVGHRRGAGAEVREDVVDYRPLGDARDDPHVPVTRRAGKRVDLEDLLQEPLGSGYPLGCLEDVTFSDADPTREPDLLGYSATARLAQRCRCRAKVSA